MMAMTLDEFLEEKLKDPEFNQKLEVFRPEYEIIKSLIQARNESGLTQEQLSERTGITEADISKIENGSAEPSLWTLMILAAGMGKRLRLEFETPE